MKNLKHFLIYSVSLSVILLPSCGSSDEMNERKVKLEKLKAQQSELASEIKTLEEEIIKNGDQIETNEKVVPVAIATIQTSTFEHFIDVQGRVDGDANILLMPKGQGPITKIFVKAGSKVKENEVLAEIYNDAQTAQYASMRSQYLLAVDVYNRQKSLWEKGIGTEMQFLQSKTQKESMEKQLAVMHETLEMTKIKSPINGTIDDVMVKVGQMASPMQAAFRVVNIDKLKVKADIAENYASRIKEGNEVLLEFPDINKSLRSKVSYSGKSISQLNRTFNVEVQLPSDQDYLPNMIAIVKVIDYSKPNSIVVPVNCIQNSEGKSFVFVATKVGAKNTANKREVQVGVTYNDKAEIISGLQIGEQVITLGYEDLNDGVAVKF